MGSVRTTFAVAGLVGTIAAGGAIAAGASSFATTSGSASTSPSTVTPTSSTAGATTGSGAPSAGSTPSSTGATATSTSVTSVPSTTTAAHRAGVTFRPRVTYLGNDRVRVSLSYAGYAYISSMLTDGREGVFYYVDIDDRDVLDAGDPPPCPSRSDAVLRPAADSVSSSPITLSPGKHTMTVVTNYCGGPSAGTRTLTTLVVGSPSASSTTAPTGTTTATSEPPTPSPATTKLGVTG